MVKFIKGLLQRLFGTDSHLRREYWQLRERLLPVQSKRRKIYYELISFLRGLKNYNYYLWSKKFDTLTEKDLALIKEHLDGHSYKPKISIIMPVYDPPPLFLKKALDSVLSQVYQNWELCIADDASTNTEIHNILKKYKEEDPRIKLILRQTNGHISLASNSALELATGDFVTFLDHDDELTPHALYMVINELNENQNLDLIYSDEDAINKNNKPISHHFKPDWDPDLFFSYNYICHLAVYRRSILDKIGGLRTGFEGAQDYDLCLRFISEINDDKKIAHIPHILYHWRAITGSTALSISEKSYAKFVGQKALQDYFDKTENKVIVGPAKNPTTFRIHFSLPESQPSVSIIIPTKNSYKILKKCIDSLLEKTTYKSFEIVVVDNQSDETNSLDYLNTIQKDPQITVLKYEKPFNYSAINNFAVQHVKSGLIAFLNNDIEVISPDWLNEMVSHALRKNVGAVGAKLLYQNDTLQHCGVIVGLGELAAHSHRFLRKTTNGYHCRPVLTQNLSAVTAACMVLRKSVFEEVNGFDEKNLPITYGDVDLCLKIRAKGYLIVWTPFAELYHYESASRGLDVTPEKKQRYNKERNYMLKRWKSVIENDPYYNPNLTIVSENFALAWPPRASKPWLQDKHARVITTHKKKDIS